MKQGPPQGPPNKSPEKKPKILSFEKFCLARNNFFFRFAAEYIYKNLKIYKRFTREHPDMDKSFRDKVKKAYADKMTYEPLKLIERDAYEVYKIMRYYVDSDNDLFS